VLEIAEVESVSYEPGDQRLSALLKPPTGPSFRLVRRYDAAAPGALAALANALSGKSGSPRFVSGSVWRTALGLQIDPLGIVTDRFHVPDLAELDEDTPLHGAAEAEGSSTALTHALAEACRALDDAAHHGLRRAGRGFGERLSRQASELRRVGLTRLATRFDALKSALDDGQASGDVSSEARLVTSWADAAIRLRQYTSIDGSNDICVSDRPHATFHRMSNFNACAVRASDRSCSSLSTSTLPTRSAGSDGRPVPDRNKSAMNPSSNSSPRCSARNANTLPGGTRPPTISPASNNSRSIRVEPCIDQCSDARRHRHARHAEPV